MRLLYVTQFFAPEITAGAFRAYEHCEVWREMSELDITVYTSNPNYPKGELHKGYKNTLIEQDNSYAYKVIRSKAIIRKNKSKLGRIISALSFSIVGMYNILCHKKKIGKKFDCVLGTSGPIFAGILAYIYAKIYGAKFVFEIRDITYLQMAATMKEVNPLLIKMMKFLEIYLCKKAAHVVVVTEGFKQKLLEEGIEPDKISVIHNGVSVKAHTPYQGWMDHEVQQLGHVSKLTLTYAGTIGISQKIEELIDFFCGLQHPNKQLNIIGEGAKKEEIKKYVHQKGMTNIKILDAMTGESLDQLIAESTFGVVKLKYDENFSDTIPSKLFDLMNRGIPILYLGPKGEVSRLIDKFEMGIGLVEDDMALNQKVFEEAIENEVRLRENLQAFSNNASAKFSEFFDRKVLAIRYAEQLLAIQRKDTYYAEYKTSRERSQEL